MLYTLRIPEITGEFSARQYREGKGFGKVILDRRLTLLREFAKLYNWWLQAVTRLTPRLPGACVRGYLAERVCQAVQLVVAGDHTI